MTEKGRVKVTKVEQIQAEIDNKNAAIEQEAANGQQTNHEQIIQWRNEINLLQMQLSDAKAEEVKVEEHVQANGYILDTMEVDGLTIPEIITDDNQYNLVRKGVQIYFVGFSQVIDELKTQHENDLQSWIQRATTAEGQVNHLQTANSELEVKNYELTISNDDLSVKVTKVAELTNEANAQIEQLKGHINDLQNQIAVGVRGALNVVDMPQDTSKMAADIIAKKVRITNVQFKDVNGIDRRIKTADVVLTGEHIEYEAIYEKRYIILTADEATQYKAEFEAEVQKKLAEEATTQASIPSIPQPEIAPLITPEIPVSQEDHTFQPDNQVSTENSETDPSGDRNGTLPQNLGESTASAETSAVTFVTKDEHDALAARVARIEEQANIRAVA